MKFSQFVENIKVDRGNVVKIEDSCELGSLDVWLNFDYIYWWHCKEDVFKSTKHHCLTKEVDWKQKFSEIRWARVGVVFFQIAISQYLQNSLLLLNSYLTFMIFLASTYW